MLLRSAVLAMTDANRYNPLMLTIETHCHTDASVDCRVRVVDLIKTARRRGIDRLVVTDHNTTSGAVRAQQLDPELIIVGQEIMTEQGELLAFFVSEEVQRDLPPMEAIRLLREQDAYISVSHPFDPRRGWPLRALEAIAPHVDAVEIFNARNIRPAYNEAAERFAARFKLGGTAGSDAHTLIEVGRATMQVPEFTDAASLRAAMPQVQYTKRASGPLIRLASRYAAIMNRIGASNQ